jgi:mono/diheme cytochrome c family protein
MKRTAIAFAWIFAAAGAAPSAAAPPARPLDYNRDIRPILSDNCFACHGPDATHREADLRFDDETSAMEDRGGYAAIVAGKPDESEAFRRITSEEEYERMPPPELGKELTPEEINLLRRWIEQGAPWSQHWAYETPKRHPLPEVNDREWPRNLADHFVLARLEEEEVRPAPDADRVTLLRRLRFDLTGLPPTPEEVDAFLADDRPGAVERLVDRLLGSSEFGERMAAYWLDLVRYADTVGYHGDQDHNASPYRDWVIDAFNENLPFDRFTQAQLAGDLLPDAGVDEKIASAYNRILQTSHEGGVQEKEYLSIYAADHVRNVSAVWMGATVGCAQCHDHKFDPYTAKDFYSMAAFFADLDEAQHLKRGADRIPTIRKPEVEVLTRLERLKLEMLDKEIAEQKQRLAGIAASGRREPADGDPGTPGAVNSRSSSGGSRPPLANTEAIKQQIAAAEQRRREIEESARLVMVSVPIEPRTMRVLPRGNWLDDSGPIVEPAVPEFLGKLDTGERATRLDLANWLTDGEDGAGLLTARVLVNRLWAMFFGEGLSRSLDDFGGQGEPPSHPELLDRLAVEFVESGWDVKRMVRLLVTSQTYRQSSVNATSADPQNRLFARQARFRLPAEMVRDNALAVSGLLVREMGGASVKPYQPEGYYRHLNFPTRTYKHHEDERQWRRGVYVHWQRQYLHPMLKAFDAPSREECAAQRPRSNTPLAALVLLNDPTFVEAARAFASKIIREGGESNEDRLNFAFRQTLSREPDDFERKTLTDFLAAEEERYESDETAARELTKIGLAPAPGNTNLTDLAAWTSVARLLLNLSETNTRN